MAKNTKRVPKIFWKGKTPLKKLPEKTISKILVAKKTTENLLRMVIDNLADKYHLK